MRRSAKYADIRIQGAKYQQKTKEKNLLSNPKSELLKNREIKIKIPEIRQKIWIFCFVKKFSKFYGNNLDY